MVNTVSLAKKLAALTRSEQRLIFMLAKELSSQRKPRRKKRSAR